MLHLIALGSTNNMAQMQIQHAKYIVIDFTLTSTSLMSGHL